MAKKTGGVVGIWLDDHELVRAAAKVRDAGYRNFDCITPFPVHGLEEAMGVKRSWIPFVTFIMGLTGGSLGLFFEYWTSVVSYPINVGGKPFFSAPAFIPITFECTILFAALSSVVAMILACGLPKIDPPIIDPDLTCHKFALMIPENEPNYDAAKAEQLLKGLGAQQVKRISEY